MQNINIVYKVDKSEVDRSNAAVQQAKALTDQLKKSAQDYGTTAAKANQQASGSIEAVKIKMAQLRAQIELTNRSDTKRMNDLTKQYIAAKKQVDDFNKSLKDQQHLSQQAAQGTNGMAGAFTNMYNAMKLVLAAGMIRELVDITLDAAKLAGQVEAVGNAFRRQIPNSESLLFRLRKATHGTVSDIELMQRALKFQNFGADVEQLPKLLEFAAVRAQQTGESVDYMVNSIVNGIGRKSILVLDNLGISASRLKEELGGAAAQSKTTAEVTAAVARVAGEELEKMGGFAENSATAVDKLNVSIEELRVAAAKKFESGGLLQFFQDVVDGAKAAVEAFSFDPLTFLQNLEKNTIHTKAYASALETVEKIKEKSKGTAQEQQDNIQQEINSRVQLIGKYNDTIKSLEAEADLIKQKNPYSDKIDSLHQTADGYAIARYEVELTIKALAEYYKTLKDTTVAEQDSMVTLKTLNDQLKALKEQREEATSINDTKQLDNLKRQIILLEDRILKIDNNIEWEKKWTASGAIATAQQNALTDAIEDQEKALDRLHKQFRIDDIGKGTIQENINLDDFELEVPVRVKMSNEDWTRFKMDLRKAMKEAEDDIINSGFDIAAGLAQSVVSIEQASFDIRLQQTQDFYSQQQELAGDNERFKKELAMREQRDIAKLQKEQAERQKRAKMNAILIDTAASVGKTAATLGFPAAIPFIAIALATGAAQYAIASKTPTGYKDGVIDLKGPGTATSDSIPANLSRGESVMTAKETRDSKKTLQMIRAKTLDDKVLSRIASRAKGADGGSVFDDSRMSSLLEKVVRNTTSSDFIKKGSQLYEVKKENDQHKKLIRSKYGL